MIFLGLKFWPKVIFLGLLKTPGSFWIANKNGGVLGGCEERTKRLFGYARKGNDFLGRQTLKL